MAGGPAKFRGPIFGDEYSREQLQNLVRDLEAYLERIRIDGPLIIGGGQVIDKYFMASATWNPANLNNGTQTTTTIAVTGVRLADACLVLVGFNKNLSGMRLTGYVSADDTVTVVLRNDTGGALNLDEGTLRVGVLRH